MRRVEIVDADIEEVARAMAREGGYDPDVLIAPGRAQELGGWLGNCYVAPTVSFPLWYAYRSLAMTAFAHAGALAGVVFAVDHAQIER
jgi:hypothetical protein